jgi:hypothetical protein
MSAARMLLPAVALWSAVPAAAQWDPPSGQWGKADPAHVRVMTWNIYDHICRTADKPSFNG